MPPGLAPGQRRTPARLGRPQITKDLEIGLRGPGHVHTHRVVAIGHPGHGLEGGVLGGPVTLVDGQHGLQPVAVGLADGVVQRCKGLQRLVGPLAGGLQARKQPVLLATQQQQACRLPEGLAGLASRQQFLGRLCQRSGPGRVALAQLPGQGQQHRRPAPLGRGLQPCLQRGQFVVVGKKGQHGGHVTPQASGVRPGSAPRQRRWNEVMERSCR